MSKFKKVCPTGNAMVDEKEDNPIILETKQEVNDFINEGLNLFDVDDIIRIWKEFDKKGCVRP